MAGCAIVVNYPLDVIKILADNDVFKLREGEQLTFENFLHGETTSDIMNIDIECYESMSAEG